MTHRPSLHPLRTAPLAERGDRSNLEDKPSIDDLPPSLRAELGAHWAKRGQTAYASIASLARFSLELLALGAPHDLVTGAQTAMGDKLEHARLCFGLATTLGGRPVGPGPLSVQGTLEGGSLAEVVKFAVTEGCVGETLAALEGAEALTLASDRAVCEVLTKVCDDERRHAELAWRFVRWALDAGGEEAYETAAEALLRALEMGETSDDGESDGESLSIAFGRLPGRFRAELRRRALCEVVGPCAEQVLATATPTASPGIDAEAA